MSLLILSVRDKDNLVWFDLKSKIFYCLQIKLCWWCHLETNKHLQNDWFTWTRMNTNERCEPGAVTYNIVNNQVKSYGQKGGVLKPIFIPFKRIHLGLSSFWGHEQLLFHFVTNAKHWRLFSNISLLIEYLTD